MNSKRLEQLLKFLEETPNDPFVLYALAMEYKSTDPERTTQLFNQLLIDHPEYLPAYYQAAQFKEENDLKEEALELYTRGIELAKKQDDHSTLKELKAAYTLLMED